MEEHLSGRCCFAILVSGVLLLTGCMSEPSPGEQAPTTGSSANGVPPEGQDWDLTAEEVLALYEESVDELQERGGFSDDQTPDLVRIVSPADWAQTQVDCMTERGIPTQVSQNGIVLDESVPLDQGDTTNLAFFQCAVQFPIDPRFNLPLPRERAELQYDFLVDTVATCLKEQGIQVSDPPSLETWLSRYYAGGESWYPFNEAASQVGMEQLDALYLACPSDSPDLYPPPL